MTRGSFTQVRAARMRKTLVLLGGCIECSCTLELAMGAMRFERAKSFSCTPWASFYRRKGLPQWHTGGGKSLQCYELIARITGQDAFNAWLRCPFTLLGTGARPVPSVAAPSCFDMRPGQQCMRRHVGRQEAEVARWWSLHEGLHVATQVPTQLVGSAAACERRRGHGWCGPGSGLAITSGKGLVGCPGKGLAVARWLPRQGSCRGPCGFLW